MNGDFLKPTIKVLAKRSGEKCSKCKRITSKPKSSEDEYINLGEAAHIRGNKPGKNTRYDINMSDSERSHISNGIWLCTNCHKEIDSDESIYTVDYLLELKQIHEREIFIGKFDINYLPIIENLNKDIDLLKAAIKDKENILDKAERLFNYELNSLKQKLIDLNNDKQTQIKKANQTIDSLLKLDIEEDSELSTKALELFKSGQFINAIEILDDEKLYKKERSIARLRLAKANLYNFNNDYDNALNNYQKAVDICCEYEFYYPFLNFYRNWYKDIESLSLCNMILMKEDNDGYRTYIYGCIGEIYVNLADLESSIEHFNKSLELMNMLSKQETKEYKINKARLLKSIGAAYRHLGKYEESRVSFEDSLNIYFQLTVKYNVSYVDELIDLYSNIGNLYNDVGFPKEALIYLLKAYAAFEETGLENCLLKSVVCLNIKNSYFHPKLFDIKEAKKYTEETISLLNEYADKSPYETLEKLSIALISYGDILMAEKNYKQAEIKYNIALDYALQLFSVNKMHFASTLSAVYNNTSVFYKIIDNPIKANDLNIKAIETLETVSENSQVNKLNLVKTLLVRCELILIEKSEKREVALKMMKILNTCTSNVFCDGLKQKAQQYIY